MDAQINFTLARRKNALERWLFECRAALSEKFPRIEFDSDDWPIKTLYQTEQPDWHFTKPFSDFAGKDKSFREVFRCLVAETILDGKPKCLREYFKGYRVLKAANAKSIFELTATDCKEIEARCLSLGQKNPKVSSRQRANLVTLQSTLEHIASKGVVARLGYVPSWDKLRKLQVISGRQRNQSKANNNRLIDRKIEALNDAIDALLNNDPRLDAVDRVAICSLIILMCAPSRINEVLCMAIDDYVTLDDYAYKDPAISNELHSAHQMLLITMKGSKGAQWSSKPALLFMIDLFHYAMKVILQHGERSRMLVQWYQKNPNTLYLPPDLEYLRGKDLSRRDVDSIARLCDVEANYNGGRASSSGIFKQLGANVFKAANRNSKTSIGGDPTQKFIDYVPWSKVETVLLHKVHSAFCSCRKVTINNYYQGDLAKMLFLFDTDATRYLPDSFKADRLEKRLRPSGKRKYWKSKTVAPSLFEKLSMTMPVAGKTEIAEISSHDPRRWLTTMALRHGENLSDVLVNLWANRFNLEQLKAYDLRLPEETAALSQMPQSTELVDLSTGLEQVGKLEVEYGLKTAIVTVHSAGISVTSMNLVMQATENRPVAKTSSGIFIIYPSRYGICIHPHYAVPCTNYSSCITCDENGVMKGHLPTNEALRKRDKELFTSIVRQLEILATTHNRKIADDQDALAAHMIKLVRQGLNHDAMEAFAKHLIDDFHELKHRLTDKLLATRLEEAFVTTGYVRLLDDLSIARGAFMKYHNPTVHASPKLEMISEEQSGGRDQIKRENQQFIHKYPIFALSVLPTTEQRQLAEEDAFANDDGEEEDEE